METIAGDVVECQFDDEQDEKIVDMPDKIRHIGSRRLSLIGAYLRRGRARKR